MSSRSYHLRPLQDVMTTLSIAPVAVCGIPLFQTVLSVIHHLLALQGDLAEGVDTTKKEIIYIYIYIYIYMCMYAYEVSQELVCERVFDKPNIRNSFASY